MVQNFKVFGLLTFFCETKRNSLPKNRFILIAYFQVTRFRYTGSGNQQPPITKENFNLSWKWSKIQNPPQYEFCMEWVGFEPTVVYFNYSTCCSVPLTSQVPFQAQDYHQPTLKQNLLTGLSFLDAPQSGILDTSRCDFSGIYRIYGLQTYSVYDIGMTGIEPAGQLRPKRSGQPLAHIPKRIQNRGELPSQLKVNSTERLSTRSKNTDVISSQQFTYFCTILNSYLRPILGLNQGPTD